MAFARLSALGSVSVAVLLAALVPGVEGTRSAVVAGWLAVLVLALGLLFGERAAVVFAAVAFMIRIAMVSVAIGGLIPPVWAQVALLVVVIELASVSMEARTRATPLWPTIGRTVFAALLAAAVGVVMESAVYGSAPGGLLLRVIAVGAVIVLAGWVVTKWGRAVE